MRYSEFDEARLCICVHPTVYSVDWLREVVMDYVRSTAGPRR